MINYIGILVATIVAMIIGMLWYSPLLFFKPWMRGAGLTERKMKQMKTTPVQATIVMFISQLVLAYVFNYIFDLTNLVGPAAGALLGVMFWLGFIATTQLGTILWEGKPVQYYAINAVHYLISLAVIGAIIGAFA